MDCSWFGKRLALNNKIPNSVCKTIKLIIFNNYMTPKLYIT